MNGYIIVLPVGLLSSEARAKAITRELYNITVPVAIQADYQKDGTVFGVVVHPDGVQHALQVDTDYIIPVHERANLEKLVAMFPDLTDQERVTLTGYIHTNDKFPFGHIVPSTTTVRTHEEMQALGWFPEDIEP
jgi:hypothetical protein